MKRIVLLVAAFGWLALAVAAESRPDIKAFCIDFNWGEGGPNGFAKPGLWAEASPQQHVQWYADLGCNVIQTFAVSCNGYAWYQGGKIPPQPGLQHNFLKEVVELGHARGMRVMGYFCVGANTLWGRQHPALSYGIPSAPHIPFTTEYLDYLAASITEALKLTGMDGFMIDWVWTPGDFDGAPLRWLDCEQKMYRELYGKEFPGAAQMTKAVELEFRRKSIDRCWTRIRQAAKAANPKCVVWLSCSQVDHPSVINSQLFHEVDWLMNEATDPATLTKIAAMKGPETQLVQCVVGWGDAHDARKIVTSSAASQLGIYGFAKPAPNSLPTPVETFRSRSIASFQGNDRNIAVLARFYKGLKFDQTTAQEPDGRVILKPSTVNASGTSPVVEEGQVGRWANAADQIYWLFSVSKPSRYRVSLSYACPEGKNGSTFQVELGDQRFSKVTEATGADWRHYRELTLGEVELAAGRQVLTVKPLTNTIWRAMSLKEIKLEPVQTTSRLRDRLYRAGAPLVIGHRGFSRRAPENTLASFRLALAAKADLVELDYHPSKDGVPIVLHDHTLDRTTDATNRWRGTKISVGDYPAAALAELDAGRWFGASFAGTKLPTLEEALDVIQPTGVTLIERKSGSAEPLIAMLERRHEIEAVVVQSFDWNFIRSCHARNPKLTLGALGPPGEYQGRKLTDAEKFLNPEFLATIKQTGAELVVWNASVNADAVALAHQNHQLVWVYTIDDPAKAIALVELGVDGIITNDPITIRQAIRARTIRSDAKR